MKQEKLLFFNSLVDSRTMKQEKLLKMIVYVDMLIDSRIQRLGFE